jgi:hypothetical protein
MCYSDGEGRKPCGVCGRPLLPHIHHGWLWWERMGVLMCARCFVVLTPGATVATVGEAEKEASQHDTED